MPSPDEVIVQDTASDDHAEAHITKLTQQAFDPVQYFNESLSPLSISTQTTTSQKQNRTLLLQTSSTEVQRLLSQLSAVNLRSASELSSLVDEVLRGGNRLAYEVEVLRGNANSLYELLTETLRGDVATFVTAHSGPQRLSLSTTVEPSGTLPGMMQNVEEPEFVRQLRLLSQVKTRLEAVIHVFGEALKWPVARSDVSMTSNLISVSAPELGVMSSAEDDKARDYTRRLRSEITDLLESDGGRRAGLEAAADRVEQYRNLAQLWKGTSEEKARLRIVDGLMKMVEDRKKTLDATSSTLRSSSGSSAQRSTSVPGRAASRIGEGASSTAAGLFRNLQKLRDEIYLE